ncbi:MAG: polysaccharide biosynthesis protein [Sedimentisphaerales bacterium]|nr:polysaccharide biosynthesis protein [Sedimentisphaerales bacterium]
MGLIRKNIIANLCGRGWSTFLAFAVFPIYLTFLGVEAYALIGFHAVLFSLLGMLDLGLSTTLTREQARLSVCEEGKSEQRDLLFTMESVYGVILLTGSVVVVLLAKPIALYWLKANTLSEEAVIWAIRLMGPLIGVQMYVFFYHAGLLGLQKQVAVNIVSVVFGTSRCILTVLFLWLIWRNIVGFFICQVSMAIIEVITLRVLLWKILAGSAHKVAFRVTMLREAAPFAGGILGNSLTGVILVQMDKFLLSRLLPLDIFGYYVLASMGAHALWPVITAVNQAFFPKYTQLLNQGLYDTMTELHHRCNQLISFLLFPIACLVFFFSYELILFWTHDSVTAVRSHHIFTVLIVGVVFAGLAFPYVQVLFAAGKPHVLMWINLFSIPVFGLLFILLVSRYGAIGAAITWSVVIGVGKLLSLLFFVSRPILKEDPLRWFTRDCITPFMSTLAVGFLGWLFCPKNISQIELLLWIGGIYLMMCIAAFLSADLLRGTGIDFLASLVRWRHNKKFNPGNIYPGKGSYEPSLKE